MKKLKTISKAEFDRICKMDVSLGVTLISGYTEGIRLAYFFSLCTIPTRIRFFERDLIYRELKLKYSADEVGYYDPSKPSGIRQLLRSENHTPERLEYFSKAELWLLE